LKFPTQIGKKLSYCVKQLVEKMGQFTKELEKKLADLETKQQELLEKINCTSKNSSSPPSLDPLNAEKRQEKKKSAKKRGGQPGHKGHSRNSMSHPSVKAF
jgi:transposase